MEVNPGQKGNCQAPILYHFGQAHNPRRLVVADDDSLTHSLMLPIATYWQGFFSWVLNVLLFTPLYGLMVIRYRRGDAFHCSRAVGNYAQLRASSCQGSEFLASHPQAISLFRENGSHSLRPPCQGCFAPLRIPSGRRSQRTAAPPLTGARPSGRAPAYEAVRPNNVRHVSTWFDSHPVDHQLSLPMQGMLFSHSNEADKLRSVAMCDLR
jgi:hypothetical protein